MVRWLAREIPRAFAYTFVTGLVLLFLVMFVRGACHECLALPSVAICERGTGAVDVQIESSRYKGRIVEREFAGCYFYWHENNTGGN